ncbi:sulfite exporter TauE/SafE family protein [Massilia scottii]|uniref:sulfite exporter TauE/SafE family protein n=1 Tax=Massilia scottii TaxID=3057166 RepID=UPI0027966C45|nr:sulfite exporter TauE/SafE family protein [Massilia sp. CCM 9029]MDQ1835471.1 sulfite exporter TauE/SafE family protein [Massilia sp. CCM 9029]
MLTAAGFLTGLLVGLTGVGGGAVMTPLLLLVFGIAPATAIGTDLWFAVGTKVFAARLHHASNLIDWPVVRRLWWGSLPASALTLLLLQRQILRTDVGILKMAVAVAVILTALGFIFQGRLHAMGRRWRLGDSARFMQIQGPLTVLAGMVLGAMVTLTSIGAGAFGAVILAALYPLRLTPAKLIATDIMHAIPLALFAGLGHLLFGHVDVSLLFWLLIGSIPGVLLGAYCSSRLPQSVLRAMLGGVLLLVGGRLCISILV